jgi:hypothetical protein
MSADKHEDDARLEAIFADPPAPIPRFNWGAFFIPPIWGVANGQWPGVFFLPLWVFIDNMLRGPQTVRHLERGRRLDGRRAHHRRSGSLRGQCQPHRVAQGRGPHEPGAVRTPVRAHMG